MSKEKCEKMDCNMRCLGRWLYALPFVVFGASHLFMADQMVGAVPAWVPGGVFWVYFTGVAMLAAGVSMLVNKWAKLAAKLLAVLLLVYVVTIHVPGLSDEATQQMATIMVLKDVALIGGALMVAGTTCLDCKKKK